MRDVPKMLSFAMPLVVAGAATILAFAAPPPPRAHAITPEQTTRVVPRSAGVRGDVAAPEDTLYHRIEAGQVLVFSLPDSDASGPVDTYTLLRTPALSWLVDRSFFWQTLAPDTGAHDLVFGMVHGDALPDTLVVRVDVE